MAFITKEGYLFKYGSKLTGSWDNRYFKLEKMYLHYYETKDSASPRKTVLRADIVSVTEKPFDQRNNCLEISLKGKSSWYIQCKSEFELTEWARALLSHFREGDPRRDWLDKKTASALEPPVKPPQMPQYMTHNEEPPSYRTAYYQPPPPVAPGYHQPQQGGGGGAVYPSAPYQPL